jgi:hypothetical protein
MISAPALVFRTMIRKKTMTEELRLYRLVPIAAPNDPNWDNAPSHGEVLVAALTAGDARIVAEEAELDFLDIDSLPVEGNSTKNASAFRNEKLYTVIEEAHRTRLLKRGVVDGRVSVDNIISTQI